MLLLGLIGDTTTLTLYYRSETFQALRRRLDSGLGLFEPESETFGPRVLVLVRHLLFLKLADLLCSACLCCGLFQTGVGEVMLVVSVLITTAKYPKINRPRPRGTPNARASIREPLSCCIHVARTCRV
jgi:hypothetical protein